MRCQPALCIFILAAFSLFPRAIAQEAQAIRPLELNKSLERELAGGQIHASQLTLAAEQYLHLIVEQRGIDVVVLVFGPDGKKLAEVDSPNGTQGPEVVSLVAEAAGSYRIEVRSLEKDAAAGRYEISVRELRAATAQDKSRVMAARAFLAAEQFRSQGQRESLRRASEKYEEALTLWRAAKDSASEADTLLKLGQCHISLNEYSKAKDWLEKALALQQTTNARRGEAETLHNLGRVYYFTEDKDRALAYYDQALSLWRASKDPVGEAATLNNIGLIYDNQGERRKALGYFEQALPLWRAGQDRQGEGTTLDNMSRIYSFLGEKQKALGFYQQALALARATGSRPREATTLHNLGNLYHSLGEMEKSLDFYQQSLTIARALGDQRREALTLTSIGVVYDDLGEKQKAMEHYTQSLPLRRAVGDRRGEGVTLHNLGSLYLDLGEYQKALDYYTQALTMARNLGDRRGEATTLSRLGAVYDHLSEKQKALDHYNQALRLQRAIEDRGGEAIALNNIGFVYNSLGEKQKALDYFQQALQLQRKVGNRFQEGAVLDNIGKIYYALGDKQKALEYYNQALSSHQAVRNREGEGIALNNLGTLYNSLGERQKAVSYYQQSLALSEATSNRRETAYTLHNLGRVQAQLGEKEKALDSLNRALALNRTLHDREGEAITRYTLALVERERGNLREAHSQVASALALIEAVRTGVVSQEARASFLASVQNHYQLNVDLLMQLDRAHPTEGFAARALESSERARARSLLEILAEARVDLRQGADATLLERERALQQQLNARERARMLLLARKHTPEQAAAADKELRALTTQYQELQTEMRTKSPRYAALTQPQPLKLAEIQQQVLDADTLLLQYTLGEERSYLWVVSRDAVASYELPKRADVETAARGFYEALVAFDQPLRRANTSGATKAPAPPNIMEAGAALSRLLLAPVAAQLGTKRLLIVADGALQYVPFGALPEPKDEGGARNAEKENLPRSAFIAHPLIVEHEIISLPSASSLAVLRRELAGRKPAAKALALFADPVFAVDDTRLQRAQTQTATKPELSNDQPLTRAIRETGIAETSLRIPRLPGTRREAATIAALLPTTERKQALDFEASRAVATSEELSQYRIIHFATHGLLNSQHPELSGLVLSLVDAQGQPQDGFLRMHEIYDLKLPAELIVLSACQTGLGKEVKGEGLVGLTRGFMYAGAARVMASLWKVDDRATAELMKHFYQGMVKDGLRPAAALRAAQVQMWKQQRWSEPYYWAAFVLQGEWK
jgi:tetratricopeptide (TPR) repeat protein/CHAT domain-containing protein